MDLSYSLRGGGVVDLYWTDGAGTNTVYRNGSSLGTASNSYSDNLTDAGYYTYEVANADGATDPVSFYWSGFEI
jgi:hypothetical protein